jgi:predicted RNA-binding protein
LDAVLAEEFVCEFRAGGEGEMFREDEGVVAVEEEGVDFLGSVRWVEGRLNVGQAEGLTVDMTAIEYKETEGCPDERF